MTRRYKRENRVFPKDRDGNISFKTSYISSIDEFSFAVYPGDNEHFTVTKNGIYKTVKITCDPSYVYKLQKSKISARGGALGLFEYIDKCLFENFCECHAWKILDFIIESTKSA